MIKKRNCFNYGYILLALLLIAIAVCFFAFNNSLKYLAIAIGVLVIVFAAFLTVLTIADKNRQLKFFVKIVCAVAILASGIAVLVARDAVISVIIGILGLVMIIDGSFKLQTAATSKRYSAAGWWIVAVLSILIIAGGYVTVRFMVEDTPSTMIFMGCVLFIDAVGNIFSAFYLAKCEKLRNCEIAAAVKEELANQPKDTQDIY